MDRKYTGKMHTNDALLPGIAVCRFSRLFGESLAATEILRVERLVANAAGDPSPSPGYPAEFEHQYATGAG